MNAWVPTNSVTAPNIDRMLPPANTGRQTGKHPNVCAVAPGDGRLCRVWRLDEGPVPAGALRGCAAPMAVNGLIAAQKKGCFRQTGRIRLQALIRCPAGRRSLRRSITSTWGSDGVAKPLLVQPNWTDEAGRVH